jgi:hypothetical protein
MAAISASVGIRRIEPPARRSAMICSATAPASVPPSAPSASTNRSSSSARSRSSSSRIVSDVGATTAARVASLRWPVPPLVGATRAVSGMQWQPGEPTGDSLDGDRAKRWPWSLAYRCGAQADRPAHRPEQVVCPPATVHVSDGRESAVGNPTYRPGGYGASNGSGDDRNDAGGGLRALLLEAGKRRVVRLLRRGLRHLGRRRHRAAADDAGERDEEQATVRGPPDGRAD